MVKKNKNKKRTKSSRAQQRTESQVNGRAIQPPDKIPQIVLQKTRRLLLRFSATNSMNAQSFAWTDLSGLLGVFAITATTSAYIYVTLRLQRIRIWSDVLAVSSPPANTTVSIELPNLPGGSGILTGPPFVVTGSSGSTAFPAKCGLETGVDNYYGTWHNTTDTNLAFVLTCPQYSTVDLLCEGVIDDLGGLHAGPVLVGATPGNIYHKIVNGLTVLELNSI